MTLSSLVATSIEHNADIIASGNTVELQIIDDYDYVPYENNKIRIEYTRKLLVKETSALFINCTVTALLNCSDITLDERGLARKESLGIIGNIVSEISLLIAGCTATFGRIPLITPPMPSPEKNNPKFKFDS